MQGRRFAQGLCWQKLFWVLVAGSVFGVAWEHCVNLLLHGRFYGGRGLVWGPFNLVYGCGAVLLTLLLWPLRDGQATSCCWPGCWRAAPTRWAAACCRRRSSAR